MKNYRNKLIRIKARWARLVLETWVRSVLLSEWVGSLKPAQMIAPAALLLFVNMLISLGVYQSAYAFLLSTLLIIALSTAPMLFKTRNAHWVGRGKNSKPFGDVLVYTVTQIALGAQARILTRHTLESFAALLFVSFLLSVVSVFIFKSCVWPRLLKTVIKT